MRRRALIRGQLIDLGCPRHRLWQSLWYNPDMQVRFHHRFTSSSSIAWPMCKYSVTTADVWLHPSFFQFIQYLAPESHQNYQTKYMSKTPSNMQSSVDYYASQFLKEMPQSSALAPSLLNISPQSPSKSLPFEGHHRWLISYLTPDTGPIPFSPTRFTDCKLT